MKTPAPFFLARKLFALLCVLVLLTASLSAQTYYSMTSGDYSQSFTGWTAYAVNWNGLPTNATGTIPSATRITATSTNIISPSISSGVLSTTTSTNLQFLSTGTSANTTSVGADLNLNFSGRNAGTISFAAATVNNSTGDRLGTLQLYCSSDGTTWSEITGTSLPFTATNNVARSASVSVSLPAALNNQSTVKLRFYYYNGPTSGSAGSRPKISIDDILVTSTPASAAPVINAFTPSSGFASASVKINGFNFGATPAVRFNGVAAAATVNQAGTEITATVPSLATTGKITVGVTGQGEATSETDFTVISPGTPILNLSTNTITGLSTSTGSPSAATNYTVTGTNLGTTAVTIAPDSVLEVGTDGTNFASTLSLTPSGGAVSNTIYLRVASTNSVTDYSAIVSHVSGSASAALDVSGAVTNPVPGLALSPTSLTGFTTTTNTPSAAQTFTVAGSNLTTDVTVGAPTGYEVANDAATWGATTALTQAGGNATGTISVRLAATNVYGPRSGNVTVASGTLTVRLAVSGAIPVPNVPGLVYWDFNSATPTSGTGGAYSSWTFGPLTQNNNNGTNTTLFTTTSASFGYTNPFSVLASGSTNAAAAARGGELNTNSSGSAFFQVQVIVPSNTTTSITNISFGSRSTPTGPAAYSIRSSVDNFAADTATNTMPANSTWAMYVAPVSIALTNGTNTIRIYGYNGTATTSTDNWRIDDLTLALGISSGPTPPSGLSYTPSSVNGVVGTAITNMVPVITGTVDSYTIDPALPSGLSINPTTGVIDGVPLAASASASYTITATNTGGSTTAQVTMNVVSAYQGWLNGQTPSAATQLAYAIGGATSATATNGVAMSNSVTASNLSITAIVRTNDPDLSVFGQSITNLPLGTWNTADVTRITNGVDQTSVPAGNQRQIFSTPRNSEAAKFLRLQSTLTNQ